MVSNESSNPQKSLKQLGKELVTTQTLGGMRGIIDEFVENEAAYPPAQRQAKLRLGKLIREEYVPLSLLLQSIPSIKTARLAKPSNHGPDAFLVTDSGEDEIAVQITTAGEDEETHLERQMLEQGRPVFPRQETYRDPVTNSSQQRGRMLQRPKERTSLLLSEARAAVQKRIDNYREGTQFLLVSMRQSSKGQEADWRTRLHRELAELEKIPYQAIYASMGSQVFECWPPCE